MIKVTERKSAFKIGSLTMALSFFVFFLSLPFIAVASGVSEDDVNSIHFPSSKWAKGLLDTIETGPGILSKDDQFDILPPPANSSEVTLKELEYLRELSATKRDEKTIARILYEDSGVSALTIFKDEGLVGDNNYETISLLTMMNNDHLYFILEPKKRFSRPRPSQLDETLDLVIFNPPHASYPSGHASQAYIVALVLSDFDPQNSERYKQFAIDIAHRREIAGVHYPSDSVAGRKLAVDFFARMREIPVFEKKYQAAKATYVQPDFSQVGFKDPVSALEVSSDVAGE